MSSIKKLHKLPENLKEEFAVTDEVWLSPEDRMQVWANSEKICTVLFGINNWLKVLERVCPDFTHTGKTGLTTTKDSILKDLKKLLEKGQKISADNMHITNYNRITNLNK